MIRERISAPYFIKNMSNKSFNKKTPELLAPAGNKETFYAVLKAGADAVYLAGNKYGARAYADNFSQEEICECIKYAHLYNKRVYMTVNTLLTESELDELYTFLRPMYETGLDGVIVQDLGVIRYISKAFPSMELHASTQLNTTGIKGAELLKSMGVCRIVPARELSLKEVISLKQQSGLEIECFIHGAICYCYSGQCLFSSVIGGRSGNRGRCAQPCRLPYSVNNKKDIYPLSLKDMCTIDYIPKLIAAGVDSFKIEGRMKKPEYAAGVTALYRKYIDQYLSTGSVSVSKNDRKTLESLYIRSEISNGYYERYNGADMITIDSPSYCGSDEKTIDSIRALYINSDSTKYLSRIPISVSACFITGENAYITVSYDDIYITKQGDIVESAQKKPITVQDIAKQINRLGSTIFTISDNNFENNIFVSDDAYYNLKGINELRRSAIEELEKQIISKNGLPQNRNDSCNVVDSIIKSESTVISSASQQYNKTSILINDRTQLKYVMRYIKNNRSLISSNHTFIERIYVPEELFLNKKTLDLDSEFIGVLSKELSDINNCNSLVNGIDQKVHIFIATPYVRRLRDYSFAELIGQLIFNQFISGVLVRNIDDLKRFSDLRCSKQSSIDNNPFEIAVDYGIYVWNQETISFIENYASIIGLPVELCGSAQKELNSHISDKYCSEKMVYGRIPLMHTANCINKTLGKCILKDSSCNEERWTSIKDRTNRLIPVFTDCIHCQNTIYNAVPLTIAKELGSYDKNVVFRIDFSNEDNNAIGQVLDYYLIHTTDVTWEYTKAFEKHSTE